ncbi:MAG: hypothetical protein H6613_18185 [Ignavibacteriales bacterium]|nr:hypothetical protein [Ignavibacteriales bacterium]
MNWNSVDNYSGGTVNVYIKLEDPDLNTNVGDQETINVTVASSTDETGTTVLLTETGADTDIFTGSATIYESGGSGDLEVSRGDSLIVSYNDASDDFGNAQIISADVLYGYTEISGITYTTSETWTKVLSPYLITGDVNINSGGVLTIESGVEVRFMPNTDKTVGGSDNTRSEIRVNNNGVLNAEGTIADSIKFTSQSSDPGNDDWYGIYTNESAQFNIAYSVISNARYGLHTQQLDNDNGGSSIKNSNISNVSTYGVYCYNFLVL